MLKKLAANCTVVDEKMGYSYETKVVWTCLETKRIFIDAQVYSKTTTKHKKMLVAYLSGKYPEIRQFELV